MRLNSRRSKPQAPINQCPAEWDFGWVGSEADYVLALEQAQESQTASGAAHFYSLVPKRKASSASGRLRACFLSSRQFE